MFIFVPGFSLMFGNDSALPFVGKSQYYQVCRIFLPMKGNACYRFVGYNSLILYASYRKSI